MSMNSRGHVDLWETISEVAHILRETEVPKAHLEIPFFAASVVEHYCVTHHCHPFLRDGLPSVAQAAMAAIRERNESNLWKWASNRADFQKAARAHLDRPERPRLERESKRGRPLRKAKEHDPPWKRRLAALPVSKKAKKRKPGSGGPRFNGPRLPPGFEGKGSEPHWCRNLSVLDRKLNKLKRERESIAKIQDEILKREKERLESVGLSRREPRHDNGPPDDDAWRSQGWPRAFWEDGVGLPKKIQAEVDRLFDHQAFGRFFIPAGEIEFYSFLQDRREGLGPTPRELRAIQIEEVREGLAAIASAC